MRPSGPIEERLLSRHHQARYRVQFSPPCFLPRGLPPTPTKAPQCFGRFLQLRGAAAYTPGCFPRATAGRPFPPPRTARHCPRNAPAFLPPGVYAPCNPRMSHASQRMATKASRESARSNTQRDTAHHDTSPGCCQVEGGHSTVVHSRHQLHLDMLVCCFALPTCTWQTTRAHHFLPL